MATKDTRNEVSPDKMLLESAENLFSEKTQVVKNLLISSSEVFSKDVLDQSLLSCCQNGNLLLLPAIISAGADLDVFDENGNTPLLMCALNSHESCARFLLGAGADVNCVNFNGDTPLIVSVRKSASIGVAKLLIGNKDVQIDHANKNGYTALLCAIEAANLNAIKLLFDNNASSESSLNSEEIASRKGLSNLIKLFKLQKGISQSLLLLAALNRDIETAQILTSMDDSILNTTNDSFTNIMIQFLKSIQDNNSVVNKSEMEMLTFLLKRAIPQSSSVKETIMDIAISIGNNTIIELLSQFDFVISNRNLSSAVSKPDFLRSLLKYRHIINKLNSKNLPAYDGSPLDKAMRGEEIDSAKALVQHGAYLNVDIALEAAVKRSQLKTLEYLQKEFPSEVGEKQKSPELLHIAIQNCAFNIITILLDCGADINAVHNRECSLTQAVDVNVLDLLLSRGADANTKIGSGNYAHPLHAFLSSNFRYKLEKRWASLQTSGVLEFFLNSEIEDFVKCLLRHGAKVDLKDGCDQTALHIAAENHNSVGILNILIASGANVNEFNVEGETPLLLAVYEKEVENIECLINAGADINIVCEYNGQSVIFQAKKKSILKLLLDNDADVKIIDFEGNSVLNSLLYKREIESEYVKRLIDAGCDVNQKNNVGYTALILATNYANIELLTLLVQEGADVNVSTGEPYHITAVTALFTKLWDNAQRATSCIHYLIDQNTHIDNMPSTVVHVLISSGCFSLIPRFISCGLAPSYLTREKSAYARHKYLQHISPLVLALLLNQSDLAEYFININYLMKSDISILSGNKIVQNHLQSESILNSLDLLKTLSQQPLSLETLCFVVLSETLGPTQGRRSRVQKLGLPRPLQDLLLFKNVTENPIKLMGRRSQFFFTHSLKQSNLYHLDFENWVQEFSSSDYDSDEEDEDV